MSECHIKTLPKVLMPTSSIIKTLPNGEKICCHGPCESFPDGHKVLIPTGSLRDRINARNSELTESQQDLRAAACERRRKARESMAEGDAVPPEKRCI